MGCFSLGFSHLSILWRGEVHLPVLLGEFGNGRTDRGMAHHELIEVAAIEHQELAHKSTAITSGVGRSPSARGTRPDTSAARSGSDKKSADLVL
jgi:hypothetical protein